MAHKFPLVVHELGDNGTWITPPSVKAFYFNLHANLLSLVVSNTC